MLVGCHTWNEAWSVMECNVLAWSVLECNVLARSVLTRSGSLKCKKKLNIINASSACNIHYIQHLVLTSVDVYNCLICNVHINHEVTDYN